MTPRCTWVGHS